jgi:hypothetical protein
VRLRVIIFALLFICNFVNAQVFPIQVNTQVAPPYTPYLADYTAPGSQRLMVQIRSNDATLSDYTCKLRITIDGVGITIKTKPAFIPQPITIQGGGIPEIFYGEDIAEYFNPDNLDFAGISRREFQKTGKLPEGVYRFSVEVLDYNVNLQVSNRGTSIVWVILNDPPMLNLPRKDMKVRVLDPTNIAFTWTPRHTGSPNSAFSTEYTFRLVEIWPANRNPYDAFLSQPPLYEVVTDKTQLIYGPAEPALLPGRKYAWQVQAKDVDGKDLFKNQGRSEVFVFQFGDVLSAPENLRQESGNASTISLRWEPSSQGEMPGQYRIQYRKKGTGDSGAWYEKITDQRWITIPLLQPDTEYEVQLRSEASPQVSTYSPILIAKTEQEGKGDFQCGREGQVAAPVDSSPLMMLSAGDVITAQNFKVIIMESEGSGGSFQGKGIMRVPYLNGASVYVTFAGSVNNKYELTIGEISTIYSEGSEMAQVIDEMNKIGEEKPPKPTIEIDGKEVVLGASYDVAGIIDTIKVNDKGEIVVITTKGTEVTYNQPVNSETNEKEAVQFTDSAGNTYVVNKDGKVIKKETSGGLQDVFVSTEAFLLLKKSLLEIRKEYSDAVISQLDNKLTNESNALKQVIITDNRALGVKVSEPSIKGSDVSFMYDFVEVKDGIVKEDSEFAIQSKKVKSLELEYNRMSFLKVLVDNIDNGEDYKVLAKQLKLGDKTLTEFVDAQKAAKSEETEIVKTIGLAVIVFVDDMIINYSLKNK